MTKKAGPVRKSPRAILYQSKENKGHKSIKSGRRSCTAKYLKSTNHASSLLKVGNLPAKRPTPITRPTSMSINTPVNRPISSLVKRSAATPELNRPSATPVNRPSATPANRPTATPC